MDIMMPPLRQQASPAPWLLRREKIDLTRLIGAASVVKPGATTDDVVAHLGEWGVQVSGIIVSMWMSHRDRPRLDTGNPSLMLLVKPSDEPRRLQDELKPHWGSAT